MKNNEEMLQVSMSIILNAGNARFKTNEALDYLMSGQYNEAKEKMITAREDITNAHQSQTAIIQAEARGDTQESSLLFTHAQDTLMTVMSEINLTEKLILVFESLEKRIREGI